VSQPSVLIVSDDSEFAPTIMARWQTERCVPAFLLMSTPVWSESLIAACDLALVGAARREVVPILKSLDTAARPAIMLLDGSAQAQCYREANPRLILLHEHEGWVDALVVLAGETLRRLDATARARRAEQSLAQIQAHATLGRYMIDMRHSFNNALTSVLGNSELLLLEPGAFSANVRDQIATIHNMGMRLHEILQRFNSLEQEMKFNGKSHSEMRVPGRAIPTPVPTGMD